MAPAPTANPDAATTALAAQGFYRETLTRLLADGVLGLDQRLLVVCGA